MPSTPLICSSIGVATVSAITFGLAPGYCARTTTDGGTTSGYSEIGMTRNARSPARRMSTDRTPAKIGRWMKNFDRFMGAAPLKRRSARLLPCATAGTLRSLRLLLSRRHAHELRGDRRTRAHALQTVHDDALARLEAVGHDSQT